MCGHDTYDLPVDYTTLEPRERRKVREQYIKMQRNRCMWCLERLDLEPIERVRNMRIDWTLFPDGFQNYPIHLQHCHTTGMTEGAVHMRCNAHMWQYHGR